MLRVQLISNEFGQLDVGDGDGIDPIDINKIKKKIERSQSNDGVMYSITLSIQFAKLARRFIQNVYESLGVEGVVVANIYLLDPNGRRYELYFSGRVKLFPNYDIDRLIVESNLEQTGFEVKVMNRLDADVNLEMIKSYSDASMPFTPLIDVPFHARTVVETFQSSLENASEYQQLGVVNFTINNGLGDQYREAIVCGSINQTKGDASNNFEDTFLQPFGWAIIDDGSNLGIGDAPGAEADYVAYLSGHKSARSPWLVAKVGGRIPELKLSMRLKPSIFVTNSGGDVDICGSGALGRTEVLAWFERRDKDDAIIEIVQMGRWDEMDACGDNSREGIYRTFDLTKINLDVEAGEKIYWYTTFRISGTYDRPGILDGQLAHDFVIQGDPVFTFITLSANTVFPGSGIPVRAQMIHEVLDKMSQFITDQRESFYSDFFGRTDLGYGIDGPGSLMCITSGDLIRLRDQLVFVNFKECFQSLNSIWCLGMGVEMIDGKQKIRIESKDHFYNKDLMSVELGQVIENSLHKKVSSRYYYAQVQMNYSAIDQGTVNGASEFNTIRRHLSPMTQPTAGLTLSSVYRASGLEIEALRRKADDTTDDSVDPQKFLVCVVRDGGGFKTETNVGIPTSGVFSPETAYNLRISPGQNIRRWIKVLAAMVIRQTNKVFKFSYGERNYTCSINGTAENSDIDCAGIEPIYYPEEYSFEIKLTRDQMVLIEAEPYGYIKFYDENNNSHEGFLLEVEHEPAEKLATFTLLRVYRAV